MSDKDLMILSTLEDIKPKICIEGVQEPCHSCESRNLNFEIVQSYGFRVKHGMTGDYLFLGSYEILLDST